MFTPMPHRTKRPLLISSLFLVLFLVLPESNFAQVSWENLFAKAHKQYLKGKYDKALAKKNKNVLKDINKKYGASPVLLAWTEIYEAQIREVQGQFAAMETKIEAGLEQLENIKNQDFEAYSVGIIKVGQIYLDLGQYAKADSLLQDLQNIWDQRSASDEMILAEIALEAAEAAIYMGRLKATEEKITELQERWKALSEATNGRFGKLSKYDQDYRQTRYARALSLDAILYTQKGEYQKADSLFQIKEKTIAGIKSKYPLYNQFLIAWGNNAFDREDYQEAERNYEKATRQVKSEQKEFMDALALAIESYIFREKEGAINRNLDRWNKYASAFSRSTNIYDQTGLYLSASQSFANREDGKAIGELNEILAQPSEIIPEEHPLRVRAREMLHFLLISGQEPDLEAAEANLKTILTSYQKLYGTNSTPYRFAQVRLADYYLNYTDNFAEARNIFQAEPQAMLYEQRSETHKDRNYLNNAVANYYDLEDRYEESLALLQNSAANLKSKYGERYLAYGLQLVKVADLQIKVGQYREAEQSMEKGLFVIRKEARRRSLEYAESLTTMAKIYGIFGLYDEARKMLRTSNRLYRRMGVDDLSLKAQSMDEMATLYIRLGEYAETELILQDLLAAARANSGEGSRQLLSPLNHLGLLYLIKGDYGQSIKLLTEAERIAKKIYGAESIRASENYTLLSEYYVTIGDYEQAEEYMNQVIAIQKKSLRENHIELGRSYISLALIKFYENTKNAELSEKYLNQAKAIMVSNFDNRHPLYAQVLKTIASIYIETDRFEEAFSLLEEANAIWLEKLGERNINSAQVYSLMGDVYTHLKKFEEAKDNYEQAEKIFKKLLSKEHPDYVATESKLGRLFFISGDYKAANKILEGTTESYLNFIRTYFPALSEREKAKFWSKIQADFEFYNSLAVSQKEDRPELIENMYNFRLATKAILLSSSIKMREQILNGDDEELKSLFQSWIDKKSELTSALSLSEEELAESEVNVTDLKNEINQLEKELSERSGLFADNVEQEVYTWKDVRKVLQAGEAAVEIIRYRDYQEGFSDEIKYAALIVNEKTRKQPELVLLDDGQELEDKFLRYYRNMVIFKRSDRYSYEKFWKPIEQALDNAQVVYLSPDGVYNQINIESIRIEEGRYVIDQNNIRLVSNTKDLILSRQQEPAETNTASSEAILFGNPIFYTSQQTEEKALENQTRGGGEYVSRLPGTEREIAQISEMLQNRDWQVKAYTDQEAIEQVIKTLNSPRVLHIATHGFFQENPPEGGISTESGLALIKQDPLRRSGLLAKGAGDLLAQNTKNYDAQEGIITAYEAMNLNLDHTDLVVLSACETGLGEVAIGEGVYGLQRSFLVAGAEVLIMSLFKVNDEATQKLMSKFYEKWLSTGNKRQAFNEAQKEIKEEYADPIYWGAFNMIGAD